MTYVEFTTAASSLPYLFQDGCYIVFNDLYDIDNDMTDTELATFNRFHNMIAYHSTVQLDDAILYVCHIDKNGEWCRSWPY